MCAFPLLLEAARRSLMCSPFLRYVHKTDSLAMAFLHALRQILSNRVVTRLRALIVLPTRDLVIQVRETFEAVCKGRGLKVG